MIGWIIVSLLFLLLWGFMLFEIGKMDETKVLFYLMLYLPIALPVLLSFILAPMTVMGVLISLSSWAIILLLVMIIEKIAWGVTLREISGEDQMVWFYLSYIIPLFWILYRVTKLR